MKLYLFLLLFLFTFSSCDSIENPFTEKNVYVLERNNKFGGGISFVFMHEPFENEEVFMHTNISIKFTISEEDDCVYYIYNSQIFSIIGEGTKKMTKRVSAEAHKCINSNDFLVEFFDKEGNTIYTFNNYPPNVKKREIKGVLEIGPSEFRSKIKRTSHYKISIAVKVGASDRKYF